MTSQLHLLWQTKFFRPVDHNKIEITKKYAAPSILLNDRGTASSSREGVIFCFVFSLAGDTCRQHLTMWPWPWSAKKIEKENTSRALPNFAVGVVWFNRWTNFIGKHRFHRQGHLFNHKWEKILNFTSKHFTFININYDLRLFLNARWMK